MAKEFNIKEWQDKQKRLLPEHTVTFTKDDMATLHNTGELVKADDDGKDHTYIFKGDLNEQGFDSRFKDAMGGAGFSDEEQDDIMSRDVGSPFPGEPVETSKASEIIDNHIKPAVRNMSDDELSKFNKEMVEYFLETVEGKEAAQAAAKMYFAKTGL